MSRCNKRLQTVRVSGQIVSGSRSWRTTWDLFCAVRFSWGLGMPQVAKSDHSTGNSSFASYVLKSDQLTFIFTAPYSRVAAPADNAPAVPSYKMDAIYSFINKHGLGVRAVGESLTAIGCSLLLILAKPACSLLPKRVNL